MTAAAGSLFLVLFFVLLPLGAGITMLVLSRRGKRSYPACGSCGYDISSSVGSVDRCPECGLQLAEPPRRTA